MYKIITIIILVGMLFVSPAGAAWANTSFNYSAQSHPADGIRPYQITLELHAGAGTSNATDLFFNSHSNADFSDVRYYLNDSTELSYWMEDTNTVWINVTGNGTVSAYYGNATITTNASSGNATFPVFDDFTNNLLGSYWLGDTGSYTVSGGAIRQTGASGRLYHNLSGFGTTSGIAIRTDQMNNGGAVTIRQASGITQSNAGTIATETGVTVGWLDGNAWNIWKDGASQSSGGAYARDGTYHRHEARFNGTGWQYLYDNTTVYNSTGLAAYSKNWVMFGAPAGLAASNSYWTLVIVRNYSSPEVTFTAWSEEQTEYWTNDYTEDNDLNFTVDNPTTVTFEFSPRNASYYDTYTWSFDDVVVGTGLTYARNINNFDFRDLSLKANLSTDSSHDYYVNWSVNTEFNLIYPLDESIVVTYPPLLYSVPFSWGAIDPGTYYIQVARDADFNLLSYTNYVTGASVTASLETGLTYYWRVAPYDTSTSTIGDYSDTGVFYLVQSSSVTGAGIHGVVYELIAGVPTPITGATVYLYNTTYSATQITGTNGYYLFSNLSNSTTYSVYTSKQGYETTTPAPVTTGNNTTVVYNILNRIYISPYVPNFVFEKFIVRTLFDDPYPGVTVNIYKGSELTPSFTGTTDSMGQVVFQLIKDTYYRLELSGGGLPTTITKYFYGKEETYLITITTGFPDDGDKFEDINATLYVTEINATHANLSLYYNDTSDTTTAINFYATYYNNGTAACSPQSSASEPVTLNCTVVMNNFTYLFGWNSTNTKYGFLQAVDVVNFKAQNADAQIVGIENVLSEDMLQWLSILSIIFVAGLFSAKSLKYAVVILPGVATILYWLGTFQVSALLVHSALIMGIMIYMRISEKKVTT